MPSPQSIRLERMWVESFGCIICHEMWPLTKSFTINSKRFRCTFLALRLSAKLKRCPSCELLVRAVRTFEEVSNLRIDEVQLHFAHPDEPSTWTRQGEKNAFLSFKMEDGTWSDYYELVCFVGIPSFHIQRLVLSLTQLIREYIALEKHTLQNLHIVSYWLRRPSELGSRSHS
jgi:hypothetical protein